MGMGNEKNDLAKAYLHPNLACTTPHYLGCPDGIRIYPLPRKKGCEGEKRTYEQEK